MALLKMFIDRRLLYIICALFVTAVTVTPPASSFEHTVYGGFNAALWIVFAGLILVGIGLLVISISSDSLKLSKPALIVLVVAYAALFAIPLTRGYVLYSTFTFDKLSHLGLIFDILDSGHLTSDQYPATHILVSEMSMITGLSPETLSSVVPFVFFLLFVAGCALFVWTMTGNKKLVLCTILAAWPLVFGSFWVTIMPWLFSLSLVLLLLASFHRSITDQSNIWAIVSLHLIASLTWYHPITMVFALIMITAHTVGLWLTPSRTEHWTLMLSQMGTFVAIGALSLTTYHVLSGRLGQEIEGIAASLIMGTSGGASRVEQTSEVSYTISQVLSYFVLPDLGLPLFYSLIGGGFFLLVLVRWQRTRASGFEMTVATQCFIGAVVSLAFFFIQIHGSNLVRGSQYLLIFSTFTFGVLLYILTRQQSFQSYHGRVVLTLIITIAVGGLVLYGAATVYNDHAHLTEASVDGYGWQLDHKAPEEATVADTGRDRFAYYYYGYEDAQLLRSEGMDISSAPYDPPHRLGYLDHDTVGDSIGRSYLVIRTADLTKHEIEPEWRLEAIDRITYSDHERLHGDPSTHKTYDNGEIDVWRITSDQEVERRPG